jgi:hypothetical protein
MGMSIRTAIYARSSLDCPRSTEEQVHHLRAIAEQNGWIVVRVFADQPTVFRKAGNGAQVRLHYAMLFAGARWKRS